MPVNRLVLTDFRNIQNADIQPSSTVNFIWGENGSGKTSVLEALSTLGLGRSFRTRKYKNIVRYNQHQFTLYCEFSLGDLVHKSGVSRQVSGQSLFKLDDKQVTNSLQLVNLMPLQVINASSFNILSGAPSERRQFMDWLVFHVKHSFQLSWYNYSHCLKQRNALLRSDRIDSAVLDTWDIKLAQYAEEINTHRVEVIVHFVEYFNNLCEQISFIKGADFTVEYVRGWSKDYSSYYDCLKDHSLRDSRLGYTSSGPHKSDIRIKYAGRAVSELFSRGQLKALALAMYMAQIEVFASESSTACILLVDDLPAELDIDNLRRASDWLSGLQNTQIFITGVDLDSLIQFWPKDSVNHSKLFHVKHGQISEQTMHSEC